MFFTANSSNTINITIVNKGHENYKKTPKNQTVTKVSYSFMQVLHSLLKLLMSTGAQLGIFLGQESNPRKKGTLKRVIEDTLFEYCFADLSMEEIVW